MDVDGFAVFFSRFQGDLLKRYTFGYGSKPKGLQKGATPSQSKKACINPKHLVAPGVLYKTWGAFQVYIFYLVTRCLDV